MEVAENNIIKSYQFYFACTILIFLLVSAVPLGEGSITQKFFLLQDRYVGWFLAVVFALLAWLRPSATLELKPPRRGFVYTIAVGLVLVVWLGTYLVMADYPLTRDELMAVFDAQVYAQGRLSMPLPEAWSGYALALVPAFLLDVPGHAALVSSYGPGNAMMRAAFGTILDPALMNPLLAGIGLIALIDAAKSLFPKTNGAVWVCLLGYVLSAQVLANAMTSYAMTSHLALNMVWLALFLRGGKWATAGTLVIGVWAIGLHQVVFHPLFAGPIILTLLLRKRFALFALYAVVYGAALLFWIGYPSIVMAAAGITAAGGTTGAGPGSFLTERVVPLLLNRNPDTIPLMGYNLLRLFTWNAAFLLPLAVLAWPTIRRGDGFALPLFAGILLTVLAMAFLLPFQGHGWGYRYAHPVLGNCILLAGYGYRTWAERDERQANGGVAILAAISAVVLIPFLLVTTHAFVMPNARLAELISRQKADFVVIDSRSPGYTADQVRNWPDLSNRPLLFASGELSSGQINQLCERGTVAFVGNAQFVETGVLPQSVPERADFARQAAILAGKRCLVQ